ncbi:MAG: tetrahydromethanopterin S-methyltransferase subunit A [Thermoproteota archaeon]
MTFKEKFDDAAGKVCKVVLPIKHEYYLGKGKELAICTLSSIDLLQEISKSEIIDKVAIAGRLLSENKGIDAMIKFSVEHSDLKRIILCGKEVKGHMAGQALLALAQNSIGNDGRIIGALGPYPILKSPAKDIDAFRKQVEIVDMMGTVDINSLKSACRG